MSIKKISLIAVGAAILTVSASVFADLEVKPYGAAQYRLRWRIYTETGNPDGPPDGPVANNDSTANTLDYLNLIGWHAGVNVKVDDQLSLQLQIGNDWGANEAVDWNSNNTSGGGLSHSAQGRVGFNNLYVHLANATWNPGYLYVSAGVVGLATGGPLDLLERSYVTGSYNAAVYQTWVSHANNGIIGLKVGAPIVKSDAVKVSAEITSSSFDRREQARQHTSGPDSLKVKDNPTSNPTSLFFALNVPVTAGDFKITPEGVFVVNRNFNSATEKGDHELIFGGIASYKINPAVSVNVSGAYGQISNENSKVGGYGQTNRTDAVVSATAAGKEAYESKGIIAGVGASVKAGPGTFALDVKYNNSVNNATDSTKKLTNTDNIYIDPRYTIPLHPKFTVAPRFRVYVDLFDKGNALKQRIEYRPEIILTGSL